MTAVSPSYEDRYPSIPTADRIHTRVFASSRTIVRSRAHVARVPCVGVVALRETTERQRGEKEEREDREDKGIDERGRQQSAFDVGEE